MMIITNAIQPAKRTISVAVLMALFVIIIISGSLAGTDIIVNLTPPLTGYDTTELEIQVQDRSDLNGPLLANAFALANILGYPNGSATIGTFPHFEIGVSAGVGCTNMEYFDDTSDASNNGSFPMIIPNPVLHFGFGLIGGLDFIGKIFSFDSGMYTPSYENDLATPEDYSLYSAGGRVRYNILPRFTIVPALFSFGGVTIAAGGDAMIGKMKVHGEYETVYSNIEVTDGGTTYPLADVTFTGTYDAEISWKVISGTVTAIGYFEFLTIINLYTGFGITLGTGFFKADFNGTGLLTTADVGFGTDVGDLIFTSSNKYKAHPFIPAYILGAEVSLFFIKAHVETMVNLYTGKDVTALFGVRFEF